MEVGGQFHDPANLPLVNIRWEAGWTLEPVWSFLFAVYCTPAVCCSEFLLKLSGCEE